MRQREKRKLRRARVEATHRSWFQNLGMHLALVAMEEGWCPTCYHKASSDCEIHWEEADYTDPVLCSDGIIRTTAQCRRMGI